MMKKGFSLVEIIFSIAMGAMVFSIVVSNFIYTKKLHYESSEYLNKVYLADIAIKLVKDRLYVNPDFLANINNIIVGRGGSNAYVPGESLTTLFKDRNYSDAIASKEYSFEIYDIPVIAYVDGKKENGEGYYFGLIKLSEINRFFGDAENFKTFLNVKDLERYSFDLTIVNDLYGKPEGMLKNIQVAVRYGERDAHPFKISTKIICPAESLALSSYKELQRELFKNSAEEMAKNLENYAKDMATIINGLFGSLVKVYDRPVERPDDPLTRQLKMQFFRERAKIEISAKDMLRKTFMVLYAMDFNKMIQTRLDKWIEENPPKAKEGYVNVLNCHLKKAQVSLQIMEQIYVPLQDINSRLIGSESIEAVLISKLFIQKYRDNKTIIQLYEEGVKSLPADFMNNVAQSLSKVNDILVRMIEKKIALTPREALKFTQDMISFNQICIVSQSLVPGADWRELSSRVDSNIAELTKLYAGKDRNFQAACDYLNTEAQKCLLLKSGQTFDKYESIASALRQMVGMPDALTVMSKKVDKIILLMAAGCSGSTQMSLWRILFLAWRNRERAAAMIEDDLLIKTLKNSGIQVSAAASDGKGPAILKNIAESFEYKGRTIHFKNLAEYESVHANELSNMDDDARLDRYVEYLKSLEDDD